MLRFVGFRIQLKKVLFSPVSKLHVLPSSRKTVHGIWIHHPTNWEEGEGSEKRFKPLAYIGGSGLWVASTGQVQKLKMMQVSRIF